MFALDEMDLINEMNFEDITVDTSRYDVGSKEKSMLFWHDLHKLHGAARKCHNEVSSEPEWNREVHARVLRLALEFPRATSRVWYRNITIDRIRDISLIPTRTGLGA